MIMNDPSEFSIWAEIERGRTGEFRRWMAAHLGLPEIEIHQIFGESLRIGLPIQLFSGIGWKEIPILLDSLPTFVKPGSAKTSETDLMPTAQVSFCPLHSLYYQGVSCPVCSDNYIASGFREI